ncbi:transketolase family protein [Candidatus Bathyarchaeota archaeon]|nr:transketolase family protein [Candidatus Bathyarchaeota archaeon]
MQSMEDMRDAYGEALAQIGEDPRVVVLDADLSHSNKTDIFRKKYPDRFFDVGIAEANMVGVAAGLSLTGLIPFINTFSVFAVGRVYDQIRISVCYQKANVKIVGTSAGLSDAHDGATHQSVDDVALARVLPNMTVVAPCDGIEVRKAVRAIYEHFGPVYLRIDRMPVPFVWESTENCQFKIGKANVVKEGSDVTIIASGCTVHLAVKAADLISKAGVKAEILDMHTIKPIDEEAIIRAAKKTGAFVTVEEHSVIGALGGAVAEVLGEKYPTPLERIGIKDMFGESALDWDELLKAYDITVEAIVDAAKGVLHRK